MIKTRQTKRTFSPEFKLEAIEQVVKYPRDAREVAQALELDPDHLRKWIRLYKQEIQGIAPVGNAITPEQREIQQFNVQIKRLEMEKEILKQATVLMSEMPRKLSR
jgi:transposase